MTFYLEGILPGVESSDGKAVTEGLGELELRAVGALEAVCERVELQGAGQGQSHGHLGAGDEAVGGGVGVITTWGSLEIEFHELYSKWHFKQYSVIVLSFINE